MKKHIINFIISIIFFFLGIWGGILLMRAICMYIMIPVGL